MQADYLIVGAGLTGAVIARELRDHGCDVQVVERRDHVGGNVHDQLHASGIPFHSYGPHFFRTSSRRLWRFVNRFTPFRRHEHRVRALVEGRYESWPVTGETIRRFEGADWRPPAGGAPRNFEEAVLAKLPRSVYERFVEGYTEKQWGVPARQLDAGLSLRAFAWTGRAIRASTAGATRGFRWRATRPSPARCSRESP